VEPGSGCEIDWSCEWSSPSLLGTVEELSTVVEEGGCTGEGASISMMLSLISDMSYI
jgi:hypothetical protein